MRATFARPRGRNGRRRLVYRVRTVRLRRPIALCAALAAALTAPGAALAAPPTVQAVVDALAAAPANGYADPALKLSAADKTALNNATTPTIRVAALSGVPSPAAGRQDAARRVRIGLDLEGTAVLGFPGGVNIASSTKTAAELAAARGAAEGKTGTAAIVAAAQALGAGSEPPATSTTGTAGADEDDGGIPAWVWILAIVLLAVVVVLVALRARARGGVHGGAGGLVDEARDRRAAVPATSAASWPRAPSPWPSATIRAIAEHHRESSDLVAGVRSRIGSLDGPPDFRKANEDLDRAEWHLAIAQAHIEGTAEPPPLTPNRPARCFFDVEHGLATVEIELELPGVRSVTVAVCAEDAVRLTRGEEPHVGTVSVRRRAVPWAAAPIWFGGWGWDADDLPSLRFHGRQVFSGPIGGTPPAVDDDEPAGLDDHFGDVEPGEAAEGPPPAPPQVGWSEDPCDSR